MKKQINQPSLFSVQDRTGRLKPSGGSNTTPLLHQKAYSNAQSALALEKFKASGFHIAQKDRIKAYLRKYQGSTLDEISAGTGIDQHGTISARLDDLRKDGYDLLNNHGKWSIKNRRLE